MVVVSTAAFGGDLARVEKPLDLLPGLDVDQRFVSAELLGSPVADNAALCDLDDGDASEGVTLVAALVTRRSVAADGPLRS